MQNITAKQNSLRTAIAQAVVTVSSAETMTAVKDKTVPKGDVIEVSRVAGLFGVKRTSDLIPDCHPLPVEFCEIRYTLHDRSIEIQVEVATVYKTGVEVESMHGASVVALTIYDMLKPIDEHVEIQTIKLLNKSGGKKGFVAKKSTTAKLDISCAVLVISDSVAAGSTRDISGRYIHDELAQYVSVPVQQVIVPDEINAVTAAIKELVSKNIQIIFTTGGTGASPRDITPEAIKPLLDLELPGIAESVRNYGQQRTPYAMLSRGVAGFIKNTFVATLPGSPSGVKDGLAVLLPHAFHLLSVRSGSDHRT